MDDFWVWAVVGICEVVVIMGVRNGRSWWCVDKGGKYGDCVGQCRGGVVVVGVMEERSCWCVGKGRELWWFCGTVNGRRGDCGSRVRKVVVIVEVGVFKLAVW